MDSTDLNRLASGGRTKKTIYLQIDLNKKKNNERQQQDSLAKNTNLSQSWRAGKETKYKKLSYKIKQRSNFPTTLVDHKINIRNKNSNKTLLFFVCYL